MNEPWFCPQFLLIFWVEKLCPKSSRLAKLTLLWNLPSFGQSVEGAVARVDTVGAFVRRRQRAALGFFFDEALRKTSMPMCGLSRK